MSLYWKSAFRTPALSSRMECSLEKAGEFGMCMGCVWERRWEEGGGRGVGAQRREWMGKGEGGEER